MSRSLCFVLFILGGLISPLFAQYAFDFTCVDDTIIVDTADVIPFLPEIIFHLRLQNTGALPDTYAFDCRVVDSVPGWFVTYCAGGMCTLPGFVLKDYLLPDSVDTAVTVEIDLTADSGMTMVNLAVWSVFNPVMRDSINVYAVYGTPGQYGFSFACISDTIMMDTAMVEFQFRVENTGTSPDTYELDLRIVEEVPGWAESFFVNGTWADPGTVLDDYLGVWAQDNEIYVRVDPNTTSGTEVLNLLARSKTNPSLKDSINVYVVAGIPGVAELPGAKSELALDVYPTVTAGPVTIKYGIDRSIPSRLGIYDCSGQLIRQYDDVFIRHLSSITWDATDNLGSRVPAGVYFVQLENQGTSIRKLIITQ